MYQDSKHFAEPLFTSLNLLCGDFRKFKKATTAKATSLNKRFNEQNNGAVHVRYNSWYISLPFSAKQRVMAKFCVV